MCCSSQAGAGDKLSLREVIRSVAAYRSLREPAFSGEAKRADSASDSAAFHSNVFHRFFVHGEEARRDELDDLLYFVKSKGTREEPFFVRRRTAKDLPAVDDAAVEWEATFWLNIILQHVDYTLVVSRHTNDGCESRPACHSG